MIRVGIDARLLALPTTGIGRYTAEFCKRLVNYPGNFFLYSAAPFSKDEWVQSNVHIRSCNYQSRVSTLAWSQTKLPLWAKRDRLDLFWGPSHRLPSCMPLGIARVVTIHDLVWKFAGTTMPPVNHWFERQLMPRAIALADRIVTVSQSTAEAVMEEYPSAQGRVRMIYPGATMLPMSKRVKSLSNISVNQPYFLFVGTLEPRKNLPRLLSAYASLDSLLRKKAKLVLAGDRGWGDINISALIKRLQLTEDVILTGYVSDDDLSTLYTNALFVAMPSLYEGFGLPIIEAMAHGKTVLTSDRSSMPEVVGNAGITVDPFNEKSIAGALKSLIGNDKLRNTLNQKTTENIKRFSWQNSAQAMWNVFNESIIARTELIKDCKLKD